MSNAFRIATLSPGLLHPSLAIATSRAGELAILDLEFIQDDRLIVQAVHNLAGLIRGQFGVRLGDKSHLLADLITDAVTTVIYSSHRPEELRNHIGFLRSKKITTIVEATCLEHALAAQEIGANEIIAKGHEAAGRVADETTFILLQRLLSECSMPVWAYGGIGLHTAAACAAAGAAGIVLDSQLALTRESPFPDSIRKRIASMDGSETICIGEQLGETYRVYFRPGTPGVQQLQKKETELLLDKRPAFEVLADWRKAVAELVGWDSEQNVLLIGQDGAFAAPLASRYGTAGGVLQAMRAAIDAHCQDAVRLKPLAESSPLAVSHGTRYPILQGPMTRVSDVPEFAGRVAEDGGLPFLALALMRGPEVKSLLQQAKTRLGNMSWGVGLLGFVPAELRQEQIEVIQEYRPPFALIAGGRPDQAHALEQQGITTYLHVPSPGLLKMFIGQGTRRFVFEGRECGGHVGPRTSFVLWNQMIDVLLDSPELEAKPSDFHVVFAAGIHDALSASMVSVIAAPLAARGVRIGVLLGTAYLLTKEAVISGAIMPAFQEQVSLCRRTVLLETGPGHSTRCVDSPFATTFLEEKRRMYIAGRPSEEIRLALEELNLGRLRIAAKGVTRNPGFEKDKSAPKLVEMSETDQVAQGMYMIGQVAGLRHTASTIRALHEDVATEGTQRLAGLANRSWRAPQELREEVPSDVAIIGMACLLPKASDLTAYWENILNKVDAVTEIPKDRWNWELYYDADPKAKDKIYSKWGGFLDDVPFDPMVYGMPPSSLRSIEPSQLLTLEVVRAALEDAGYAERPFARDRTSVILGAGGGAADLGLGYGARSFIPVMEELPEFSGRSREILDRLDGRLPEWTEDSFAGILTNVSAGRVANRFNLGGSNYTVDAACASSLASVSLALRELESHTSDMVIVGGVDTMQNPFTYLCFSKTQALSPRGRCRTFDESADGIAISEGIAIMVFKRLEDAERDGDRIYAVIKGSGSSSDGRDRGLTAPRPEGQSQALRRAYAKAGFSPSTVGLVEAHGTGTVAGDGAEVQALTTVFSENQADRGSCAIGSVKSMIGHTKCAAGAVGMVKAALALHHKVLPPTLGVQKPNPRARFSESPFFVNTEVKPWLAKPGGDPRRAGVSAFGFGGTNFHVVMEEYTGDSVASKVAVCHDWAEELFLWRASSRQDLLHAFEIWRKALVGEAKPKLRDLAYTAHLQAAEKLAADGSNSLCLTLIASSQKDLLQKLELASETLARPESIRINDPRGIYFSEQPLASAGSVAFLFPGQGSQYPRMLQDLLINFPEMRQIFEQASDVLCERFEKPLSTYVFPPPGFSAEEEKCYQQDLTRTQIAQPAIGAADLAMLGLLQEFGLRPDMVAGHSYGEYVALAAAGVFDAQVLIALSEARGRFIVEASENQPGAMAAIDAEVAVVAEVLKNFEGVSVANANAPRQTVASGTRAGIEKLVEYFTAHGTTARLIPVACAFHSPLVAGAQKRLAEYLSAVKMSEPGIAVYSNTTAMPYPTGISAIAERLVEHLVKPVDFTREIEEMYKAGARFFVEVGPRSVLTGLVEQILADRPRVAIASNQSSRPGLTQVLHLLAQLSAQGLTLMFDRLYRGRLVHRLSLSALQKESGAKPLTPSMWLVNGARAKPVKEVAVPRGQERETLKAGPSGVSHSPVGLSSPVPVKPFVSESLSPVSQPAQRFTDTVAAAAKSPAPIAAAVAFNPLPAVSSDTNGVPEVMAQFQQMMTRFLDTQKTIMLSFLGNAESANNSVPGFAPPVVSTARAFAAETPELPKTHPLVEPVPAHVPPVEQAPLVVVDPPRESNATSLAELTASLLAIVSERTGYPPEMLGLDLDLEAELGIDSIKRVEILGTFQQSFSHAEFGAGEGLVEKLAGVRTLKSILDRVLEQFGGRTREQTDQAVVLPEKLAAGASHPERGPGREELTIRLLSIVGERTGYPSEMLGVDLDLEADLGVDSIKRVEILGTFQQSLVASGLEVREGLMEQLAGIRTLRGIIDRIAEPTPVIPPSSPSIPVDPVAVQPAYQPPPQEQPRIQRYTLTPVETPFSGEWAGVGKSRVILVTEDGYGIARALAEELGRQGYKVALVFQSEGARELDKGSYTADLGSSECVKELLKLVTHRHGPLGGIVHLLSLRAGADFPSLDFEGWKERLRLGAKSLFLLAKAAHSDLQAAAKEGGACLLAATGMGGRFMAGALQDLPGQFPDHGGVAGLTKTLSLELPEVRVRVVDLDLHEHSSQLSEHLFDELSAGGDESEVGYEGTRRVTLKPNLATLPTNGTSAITLGTESVILITGGARGIAARIANHLGGQYHPTLVVVGRTPLPQDNENPDTAGLIAVKDIKAALMERMRNAGGTVSPVLIEQAYARLTAEREVRANLTLLRRSCAHVSYHAIDVRDHHSFSAFIDEVYAKFGRLDGVIHAAGVIEDKLIQDKSPESFDRVFDTKVDSAFVLSRKLRPELLKFLVFFSSVSGRFGNRGQGDYAAANEVLNKMAVYLDRMWPCRVVAMNWGPWDSDGMVSAEVRRQFAERGVDLIPPEVGIQRFDEELRLGRSGEAEVVIGGGGWKPVSAGGNSHDSQPLLSQAAVRKPDGSQEFVREIDVAIDLYLNDHKLDGQPVMPLAVATELMAEAVAQGWPKMLVAAVRDLRVFRGIVLEKGPKSVLIVARPIPGSSSDPVSVAVEVVGMDQARRVHYRATVDLALQISDRAPDNPSLLSDAKAFSMGTTELYRRWLFHGPMLQGIRRIELVGMSGISAELATSSPAEWIANAPNGQWIIDPLMFDSALQLLVVWAREHWDMTALPSGFQSYRRFGSATPGKPVICEMRVRSNTGGQTIHADIFFTDASSNRLIGVLEDMHGACSKALNRLAGGESFVTVETRL